MLPPAYFETTRLDKRALISNGSGACLSTHRHRHCPCWWIRDIAPMMRRIIITHPSDYYYQGQGAISNSILSVLSFNSACLDRPTATDESEAGHQLSRMLDQSIQPDEPKGHRFPVIASANSGLPFRRAGSGDPPARVASHACHAGLAASRCTGRHRPPQQQAGEPTIGYGQHTHGPPVHAIQVDAVQRGSCCAGWRAHGAHRCAG